MLAALAEHGDEAKLLAGGQSLLPVLNFRLAKPAVLVDLNRVAVLSATARDADGTLRLGAMTRQRRLERDPEIARQAPLLAEAAPWIAHPQIRTRGTLGGSLAHADPAAELPALALALDMRVRLVAVGGGERWVAAGDFFTGLFATALGADEVLAEVAIPPQRPGGWAFLEVARRHGDYAQVGVAALVSLGADGRIDGARLVYLAVGEGPVDATTAAASLVGALPSAASFEAAAQTAAGEVSPNDDIHASADFKRHLTRVVTRRALRIAADRARGGPGR